MENTQEASTLPPTEEIKQEATHSPNAEFVPVLTTLSEAYHDTNGCIKTKHIPRYRNLTQRFK